MNKNAPSRMHIVDLSRPGASPDDNTLEAQFNPTELNETLGVNWSKLAVLGFSHMPQQYLNTDNHGFSFTLTLHAIDDSGRRLTDLVRARLFLLSLCYASKETKSTMTSGAPARVLFYWPNLVTLTCVIKKLAFRHTTFNSLGYPVITEVKLDIEEIRDARLYADEVRATGTMRSAGSNTIAPRPLATPVKPHSPQRKRVPYTGGRRGG